MNNSAAKVGEIFTEAGAAFNKLAEMTMLLHPMPENLSSTQIKTPVKKKTFEEKSVKINPTNQGLVSKHTAAVLHQVSTNTSMIERCEVEDIKNDIKLKNETEATNL